MLSAIAATLAIVALGYFLKQRNFLLDSVWQAMSPLCYWVLFPGLLFDLMSKMKLSATFIGPFTAAIVAGSAAAILYALVAGRMAGLGGASLSSLVQGSLRHNGFLMLSILQGAVGIAAVQVAAIAIAFLVPISNIVSVLAILILTGGGERRGMKHAVLREIARNPLLAAMLAGVGVNWLELPVPSFISQSAALLGQGALPLLLLSIGASLKFAAFRWHAVPLGLALMAKMLVFPAALVGVGYWLGLDPLALVVLAAVGAAPTANSTYTLAAELGGDAPLMAEIVSLQTVCAAISMPLWIWLAGNLAGL
ncbi:MAG: AEC family transporter [Pseudomonadota bacterium]|nr:AEC family transporter [Pseudomonadota bacterium]